MRFYSGILGLKSREAVRGDLLSVMQLHHTMEFCERGSNLVVCLAYGATLQIEGIPKSMQLEHNPESTETATFFEDPRYAMYPSPQRDQLQFSNGRTC